MTKLRDPGTIEDAANRVIGKVTMAKAVEATGRSADYLRALTDQDKRYNLTVVDAVALDIAHIAAGGEGAPIYETYGVQMRAAHAERFSDGYRFAKLVTKVVKEFGEAGAALVAACLPGSDEDDDREAAKESQEALEALQEAIIFLRNRRTADAQAPP